MKVHLNPAPGSVLTTGSSSLDEDAAMMSVDERILGEEGSQQPCTRAEVRAAFLHLTDPLVGAAIWIDDARAAIVVTRDLAKPSTGEVVR